MGNPVVVATWDFGQVCADEGMRVLGEGGSALDAVERGARVAEADVAVTSVGRGGAPNRDGVVELDAAIMWGPEHRAGSVAAVTGILHPISVARRVMEVSPHVMLVGEGARAFGEAEGFATEELLTDKSRADWERWQRENGVMPIDHHSDTIGVLAVDGNGDVAASCSTSGAGYKHPGRVGDSPIIGSGLYVDNEVGAAAATGLGEDIMRYCASFQVVENMRQGMSPAEACRSLLSDVRDKDPKGASASVYVIALSKSGDGAGGGMRRGFPYAVAAGGGQAQARQGVWVAD
ncbi:N(4)-(beta-N-acetylglucosaminyl)-L-asparaginase [Candidatus Latescibacterota bacterium]